MTNCRRPAACGEHPPRNERRGRVNDKARVARVDRADGRRRNAERIDNVGEGRIIRIEWRFTVVGGQVCVLVQGPGEDPSGQTIYFQ